MRDMTLMQLLEGFRNQCACAVEDGAHSRRPEETALIAEDIRKIPLERWHAALMTQELGVGLDRALVCEALDNVTALVEKYLALEEQNNNQAKMLREMAAARDDRQRKLDAELAAAFEKITTLEGLLSRMALLLDAAHSAFEHLPKYLQQRIAEAKASYTLVNQIYNALPSTLDRKDLPMAVRKLVQDYELALAHAADKKGYAYAVTASSAGGGGGGGGGHATSAKPTTQEFYKLELSLPELDRIQDNVVKAYSPKAQDTTLALIRQAHVAIVLNEVLTRIRREVGV